MSNPLPVAASIRALRAFVAVRPALARCGLCGAGIAEHPDHAHLFESKAGRVTCACAACSLLFGGDRAAPYRRLPTTVERLAAFALCESDWQLLGVPIRLAFFVRRGEHTAACVYPSPAGPVESALSGEQAALLTERHAAFSELAADVEALLVVDLAERRVAFRLPIDECFRLVGLVRRHWRGASGGSAWWSLLDEWLGELARRADGATQ